MTEPTKQQRREIEIIVEVLQSQINYAQKQIGWLRRDFKSWQEDIGGGPNRFCRARLSLIGIRWN